MKTENTTIPKSKEDSDMEAALQGFRMTKQRKQVYEVLLEERDHPTATEVFTRSKEKMPTISLATVYNCLETLTSCGLVKQITLDRSPSRYCPNLNQHGHFYCHTCGEVFDVDYHTTSDAEKILKLPEGSQVETLEVAIKGLCPKCSKSESLSN